VTTRGLGGLLRFGFELGLAPALAFGGSMLCQHEFAVASALLALARLPTS
jgi:hypothetical protein